MLVHAQADLLCRLEEQTGTKKASSAPVPAAAGGKKEEEQTTPKKASAPAAKKEAAGVKKEEMPQDSPVGLAPFPSWLVERRFPETAKKAMCITTTNVSMLPAHHCARP